MTQLLYDLNPVQNIVADAIGEPGKRTFFLQGRSGSQIVSIVLEKQEVGSLAVSILQLLEELENRFPDLPLASARGVKLRTEQPFEPTFRVGELSIGYDEDEDMIWVLAKAMIINEAGQVVDPDDDAVPAVRFVGTRAIMRAMSERALEVIAQGRPTCPLCGRPIDRAGHFCPRTDGHAVPILF